MFSNILSVLNAKVTVIFSIALGCSIFLIKYSNIIQVLNITELNNGLKITIFLIAIISWVYLFAEFIVFISKRLLEIYRKYVLNRIELEKTEDKKKRILVRLISSDITMGEIGILYKQKLKKERIFLYTESTASISLERKEIIKKIKYIGNHKYEYEIPLFIWECSELNLLFKKNKEYLKNIK